MKTEEQFIESCFADFEEGDRAGYLNFDTYEVVLGTVIKATENRVVFQLDTGEAILATETASPTINRWCSAVRQWKKIPDLSMIEVGSVLSRLESVKGHRRYYVDVISIIRHKRIALKREDGNFIFLDANPKNGITVEALLFGWELEA